MPVHAGPASSTPVAPSRRFSSAPAPATPGLPRAPPSKYMDAHASPPSSVGTGTLDGAGSTTRCRLEAADAAYAYGADADADADADGAGRLVPPPPPPPPPPPAPPAGTRA